MTAAEEDGGFKTKEVVMARGEIEMYNKNVPNWWLLERQNDTDKRMEVLLEVRDELEDLPAKMLCLHNALCFPRAQFKCSKCYVL